MKKLLIAVLMAAAIAPASAAVREADRIVAVVNKDVPAYALMVGVPARQVGWMSEYGEKLDLPLHGNAATICPHTGVRYLLDGNHVTQIQA